MAKKKKIINNNKQIAQGELEKEKKKDRENYDTHSANDLSDDDLAVKLQPQKKKKHTQKKKNSSGRT